MNRNDNIQDEAIRSHYRTINRQMIVGWAIIVVTLLVAYALEAVKAANMPELEHLKDWRYYAVFAPVVTLPFIGALVIFLKKPDWKYLCFYIVLGYFVMYVFVMFTAVASTVFCFILPMLSLLILYHHPKLILGTGVASLIVNLISIFVFNWASVEADGGKNAEIQLALIVFCFGGCYVAARLYDRISKQSYEHLGALDEKNEQIQTMSLQTLTTIAKMIDAKDSYTEGHSQRVSIYSAQIAEGLGMSEAEVENIRKIALLHDIGKVGIPDLILNKPARLTDEEYMTMKNHTAIGSDIIKAIQTLPNLYEGVRYHHERYDGKGYPEGLKGEEIPFIARIIAVADAFDAMTSNRVYRRHLSDEQVLSELEHGIGTQFDPDIARITIEMMHEGTFKNVSPDITPPPARNNSANNTSEKVS